MDAVQFIHDSLHLGGELRAGPGGRRRPGGGSGGGPGRGVLQQRAVEESVQDLQVPHVASLGVEQLCRGGERE